MKKWFLYAMLLCLTPMVYAEPESNPGTEPAKSTRKFPPGCRQVGFSFSDNNLLLSKIPEGQDQTLYLIHNRGPFDVAMRADSPSKFVPTYDKILKPDSWVTFARDVPEVVFHCRTGETETLDCGEVLELCDYNNAKFPESNLGTYWITNSSSQETVINSTIKKGILLRW